MSSTASSASPTVASVPSSSSIAVPALSMSGVATAATANNILSTNKHNESSSSSNNNNNSNNDEISLWEMDSKELKDWFLSTKTAWTAAATQAAAAATPETVSSAGKTATSLPPLLQNLIAALEACQEQEETIPNEKAERPIEDNQYSDRYENERRNEDNDDADTGPKTKKRKTNKKPQTLRRLYDPFHIWTPAWKEQMEDGDLNNHSASTTTTVSQGEQPPTNILLAPDADDVPAKVGGKLAQLDLIGLINALAVIPGGVDRNNNTSPTFADLARVLHRTVSTRVRCDILRTTPQRIIDLVAPDLTASEIAAIRRRIYDTVVLGKGQRDAGQEEEETAHLATARSTGVHEIEKFKKCGQCGNVDQALFVLDRKNGDVICTNCGTVVSESITHEGSQYRKFEGEVDRNHHGDAANPLYSNAHNMSTTLGGVNQVSGAGMGGWGSGGGGGKRNLETILRNAHAYIELNVSQFGKTDRRTRTGYKDKQKRDAFLNMNHVGDALNLHEAVVQRAKELFAGFRDDRELVQQYKGVIGKWCWQCCQMSTL